MNDGEWKSIKNYENWTLSGDKTLSCANFVVIKSDVVIKTLSSDKKQKKWKGAIACDDVFYLAFWTFAALSCAAGLPRPPYAQTEKTQ